MKSPIKAKPLRNPGESLDREIDDILNEKVVSYLMSALMVLMMTLFEWWRWYTESPVSPKAFTFLAILVVPYCIFKLYRLREKLNRLRVGRDGEKAVGQYLERLREDGAKIYHDIPGQNFNLDHVVVSPSGIYVIETKTYSKPDSGASNIVFDGSNIKYNGIKTDKPIIQVKAASNWLNELLKESLGRKYNIKPVVVFPGWFIQPTSEAKASDIWVLNPKALPTFISNSSKSLTSEEVEMIAFNISRYVRNS